MKAMIAASVLWLGVLVPLLDVEPCCMVPEKYEGSIHQSAQEAVLFHHDGREELFLKINYEITGKKMPDRFAWIVTVPNEPDSYAVADKDLFRDIFPWANSRAKKPTRSKSMDKPQSLLEFGKVARVGPYEIQPVRALGKEALTGLNRWLAKNGFPTEDPKHMEWFVENKFTFLCIKITPPGEGKNVDSAGEIPPLHLSFKSDTPYYPLRFSSRQGVFNLNLYVFTQDDFDYKASEKSLRQINWKGGKHLHNVPVKNADFPKTLKNAYAKTVFQNYKGDWKLNILRVRGVNRGNSIATWKDDLFFRTGG